MLKVARTGPGMAVDKDGLGVVRMSTPAAPPSTPPTSRHGRREAIVSWWMLPAVVLSTVAAAVLGYAAMAWLDVPDGDLLITAGIKGWVAALIVLAVLASPLLVGVLYGVRAVRDHAGPIGWGALAVSSVLVVVLVVLPLLGLLAA